MSASHLLVDLMPRIQAIEDASAGIRLLREFTEALARSNAELVFLKLETEPVWARAEAQQLVDHVVHDTLTIITDTVHQFGGDLAMAEDLGRAHADAYGTRLRELQAGVAFAPRGGAGTA